MTIKYISVLCQGATFLHMTAVLYPCGQLDVKAILVKKSVIFMLMKITVY